MINIFLPDSKGNGIKPGTVHTPEKSIADFTLDSTRNYQRKNG